MRNGSAARRASNINSSNQAKRDVPISKLILAGGSLVSLLLLSSCQKGSDVRAVSGEDLAYASQVQISDLHLSAEENFLGQQVVYLDGKITNRGSQVVRQLRIRLFFRDTLNQVVLREEQEILGRRSESLGPGQTHSFQIRFDRIPDSWNREVPQFEIVSLQVQ